MCAVLASDMAIVLCCVRRLQGQTETVTAVFSIRGMSCGACVATVERILRQPPAVRRVSVALITEKAEVSLGARGERPVECLALTAYLPCGRPALRA